MKKLLEKIVHTIIPHPKNGNVPHILQEEFILFLFVFVGVLFYFNQNNFSIIRYLNLSATVYPAVLADLANQDRALASVPKLAWNSTLEKAAQMKAEDMLKNSYFAHTSPTGITPWHWLKETNYNFIYAGENLAVDFTESINVEKAWLASPKHKENILNSHFTEIGIATADGYFEGKKTTFVVEFFGQPSQNKVKEKAVVNKKVIEQTEKIVTPTVAGASVDNIVEQENNKNELKVIEETKEFVIVQNENITEEENIVVLNQTEIKPVSTWYARFIISPTKTIKIIYLTILSLILLATILMLSREYQKHHTKHLIMSIFLIIIIGFLFYIISTNNTQIFLGFK